MQNDERDTPDSLSDEPPSQPSSDEANEFETASWPSQDIDPTEPPGQPDESQADVADESQAPAEALPQPPSRTMPQLVTTIP